jgi:hypothetical protein
MLQKRHAEIRRYYGMTFQQYTALLESQGGGCAICGIKPNPKRRMPVDHSHKTGKNRGILCDRHNVALSWLESAEFPALKAYLAKWEAEHNTPS